MIINVSTLTNKMGKRTLTTIENGRITERANTEQSRIDSIKRRLL